MYINYLHKTDYFIYTGTQHIITLPILRYTIAKISHPKAFIIYFTRIRKYCLQLLQHVQLSHLNHFSTNVTNDLLNSKNLTLLFTVRQVSLAFDHRVAIAVKKLLSKRCGNLQTVTLVDRNKR